MDATFLIAVGLTVASLAHLWFVRLPEAQVLHADGVPKPVDFAGAWRAIVVVPGLIGLIAFSTLNNLLGGVFIAIMDPYGLNLVSVEAWGVLWGVASFGFLVGGALVARFGLGRNPLRALLLANVAMWTIGVLFTIRESIVLTMAGIVLWMALMPVAEAAEQTVLQRVVPYEKQGRVFGLAQAVEVAASPVSAFLVGPLAHFVIVPWMASADGRDRLGWLLGDGVARGLALVFVLVSLVGLAVTLAAMASRPYRTLSTSYASAAAAPARATQPGTSP